ncbi:MAG: 23S rRNA (uracil(1939)-C(5))-methyltransferase RlmD [Acholeplasmatales bacterium]|nr:23S rRNA (uracil(1939)-C(5))-methyltransferase RlmD [Acholeplasmatales bacterium]
MKKLEFKDIKTTYPSTFIFNDNGKKYTVDGVLDGEDIVVELDNKPRLSKITKTSSKRVLNGCKYQSECGGCTFMHVSYEDELSMKEHYLNNLFKEFRQPHIEYIKSPSPLNYRNKCQMTYRPGKNGLVCGLYEEHTHNIIEVNDCMVQPEEANEIIKKINGVLAKNKIEPYNERTKRGFLRHIFIRYGFKSKEILLAFVTKEELFHGAKNVINDLKKLNLNITTIIQNINPRDTSIVLGDKEKVLYGPGYIYEYVGDYKFKISLKSFFQINTNNIATLYNKAIELASLNKNDVVLDAYSGVGSISIFMAKHCKKVISVENNKTAVADAKINAKINGINNIDFVCDDATNFIQMMAKNRSSVDVVILDPTRDGTTTKFIDALSYLKPKKIVYISCEPITQKRDLEYFIKKGYKINKIIGVDMFPKSFHTETVCLLTRKQI